MFMKNKNLIVAVVALVVIVGLMAGVWFATRPEVETGAKAITVIVVHSNNTEKTFTYRTDAEMLGAFLEEKGLISSEGADSGMFNIVDGEEVIWEKHKAYWALYINEEYGVLGIYDTPVTDGTVYKLVYTRG
jgi:hypothetical protein